MTPITRRDFIAQSGSCAAHLALAAIAMPKAARLRWARNAYGPVVAAEPFGNLEKVSDGVWALISTPLSGDRTTLSNGGIIAGRNAVLAIEGFNQPQGAAWLAGKARELTGRWPTHVALTHYHADHANGVAGYRSESQHPSVRATDRTRTLVLERNRPADEARAAALQDAVMLSAADVVSLDLGGRAVRIVPRNGHTESDVSLELDDPSIVFCGDLFWNAMFPNFVDAIPIKLASSVRALRRTRDTVYIPGHGAIGGEGLRWLRLDARRGRTRGAPGAGVGCQRRRRREGFSPARDPRRVDDALAAVLSASVRGVAPGAWCVVSRARSVP
jgi:glyoxylase-like metal-dependent hydrolase (beta-lactamase superfamily II)